MLYTNIINDLTNEKTLECNSDPIIIDFFAHPKVSLFSLKMPNDIKSGE